MPWTKEQPEESGYYFYREGNDIPKPVYLGASVVHFFDKRRDYCKREDVNGEFFLPKIEDPPFEIKVSLAHHMI